jgi:hypothetical protein
VWQRFMDQHPVVQHYLATGDGRAFKLSAF